MRSFDIKCNDGRLSGILTEEDWNKFVVPMLNGLAKKFKDVVKFNGEEVKQVSFTDLSSKDSRKVVHKR